MHRSPLHKEFILHFGEMGSRWGINRTVGQIYALLFISEESLNAEQIVGSLGVSRSNVSMGLKELQAWNLVRLRHRPGDRRDYFTTPDDMWEIVRTLIEERRKREIDPTLSKLRELGMQDSTNKVDRYALSRIGELRELIEILTSWHDDLNRLETRQIVQLLQTGSKLRTLIKTTGNIVKLPKGRKSAGRNQETD